MHILGVEFAAPFIWAFAAVCVAGVVWVLSTATKAGIAEVVKPLIEPMHSRLEEMKNRLSEHLDSEEEALRTIDERLKKIETDNEWRRRR